MPHEQNWFCAQLGAREHYAIPRALHAAGALGGLMTDFWANPGTRALTRLMSSRVSRSLAARYDPSLPPETVQSWNLHAVAWEAQLRRRAKTGGVAGRYLGYCEVGRSFARAVVRSLKVRRRLPDKSVFFGYDTCSLEVMEHLKERNVPCIVDQIDPCRVEVELVQAEQQAWPGWEEQSLSVPDEFFERHTKEWAIADRVVVNSEWSRNALIQQGVPAEKLVVVPLCYEVPGEKLKAEALKTEILKHRSAETPLRVLFLGQVMLRKGIQYLVEAAKSLRDCPVAFDIVGPLQISAKAVASAPGNVFFHGRAPRDEVNRWYRSAHVFVLPTLSDGFAITQIEAMSNGLPVVTTPNCGSVVADGVDGFVVAPRDPQALAGVIRRYLEEPECLESQHLAALRKSKQFSLQRVDEALLGLEAEMHL
jgi:glycosyltransferase involved in cell wall biosynthesis